MNKIINGKTLILLIFISAIGIAIIWWVANSADKHMRAELLTQARIAAQAINIKYVASLTGSEKDLKKPAYQRIKNQMASTRKAIEKCRFLYLMGRRSDSEVFFFADSLPPDSKDYAPPGLVYEEVSDSYIRIFDTNEEAVVGPVTDRWGTLITALVPLRDPYKGNMIAVLGMDIDANNWNKEILSRSFFPFTVMLLFVFLILLLVSREKVAKSLRQSENKLRATLDATPFPVAVVDLDDDKIFYWSRSALTLFGHTAPTAKEWYQTAYPDPDYRHEVIERWKPFLEKARKSGQPVNTGEYRVTCSDGSVRICELYATFLSDNLIVTFNDITDRMRAEEALRESEEKYRTLFESSRDAIMTLAPPEWLFTSGNQATVELFKVRDEAEFISLGPWQLSPERQPDGRASDEKAKEMIETAMCHVSHFFEWTHCHSDGTPFPAEVLLTRMEQGGQVLLQATVRDISERKKVDKSLIKSERKWRNILVNAPQVGISLNPEAKIVFANAHFLELTGWKEEEIIGKNWFDLFIPENIREEIRNVFAAVMVEKDTHGFSAYENDILTKTGELRNVAWSNALTKDAQGNIVDVTCLGIDLTERRAAEEELLKQKIMFETMFNTISDGVVISNTRREIQLANKGMESTFGYKPEELLGKSTEMLYADHEKYRETGAVVFDENAKKGGDLYVTYYRDKAGREFPGETFGAKLFDEKNKWIGNLGIMRDITERKEREEEQARLQDQLMQAQKMESIGTLAGGIAHDFNNILSSIIGFAELALDDVEKSTILEDHLREVYTAGKRAKELVNQILAFARQSEEKVKPIQVDAITKEVLKFLRSSIPTSIEIKQNIESESLIIGNPIQVHQVLMNLCTNAAHAMEDQGGILEVNLKDVVIDGDDQWKGFNLKSGNYIEIKVSDTGAGIAPEIRDSIFEPYFTTKGHGEGTGMGLAMVQGIVESYGGQITVDSSLGEGTVFTIYLPTTIKSRGDRTYVSEDFPTGTERILFVDDEAAIAKMGSQILGRLGYSVTTRTSSMEALELFRSKPDDFDLVITDMTMPKMTGDKLAVELMKIRRDIPVILCTGYSKKISDESAVEIGIQALAYKPIVKADLAKTVRKVLDEAKRLNIED